LIVKITKLLIPKGLSVFFLILNKTNIRVFIKALVIFIETPGIFIKMYPQAFILI